MNKPDPSKLTPGVLDGYAKRAFKYGACGALAIATDSHNIYDGEAGGGSALHWTVRTPEGLLLDVDGVHSAEDLVSEYEGEADDGKAAAGTSTRADAWEWYGECQGAPVSIALARTFVEAVLQLRGTGDTAG